jgi:hypothetical protein
MREDRIARITAILLIAMLEFGNPEKAEAQGTVNFTNLGGGANAPIQGMGGLREGDEFSAQLVLSNGIGIGKPAGFLFSGIFAGGIRVVPGIPPGERVDFFVEVDHLGRVHGRSRNFSLVLGGGGTPPLPPPTLTSLDSFHLLDEPLLKGISDEYYFDPFIGCIWISPIGAHILTLYLIPGFDTDDEDGYEFCEAYERVSPTLKIDYSLQIDGSLELTWPAGSVMKLFASSSLSGENSVLVTGASYSNGQHFVAISPSAPKMFYWLAGQTNADEDPFLNESSGEIPSPNPPAASSGSNFPKTIDYRLLANGRMEIKWPIGTTLIRSGELGGQRRRFVVAPSLIMDGLNVQTFTTASNQYFFWLVEKPETEE